MRLHNLLRIACVMSNLISFLFQVSNLILHDLQPELVLGHSVLASTISMPNLYIEATLYKPILAS
jgi:hypothetical protein